VRSPARADGRSLRQAHEHYPRATRRAAAAGGIASKGATRFRLRVRADCPLSTNVQGVGAPPPTLLPELTPSPRRACYAGGLGLGTAGARVMSKRERTQARFPDAAAERARQTSPPHRRAPSVAPARYTRVS